MIRLATRHSGSRSGYTLIAVLLVIVVLGLSAYRFTEAMTAEYNLAARSTDAAQAKLFATSGLHYAAGALSDANTLATVLNGNPFDNSAAFSNVQIGPGDTLRGPGSFSLISVGDNFTGAGEGRYQIRYGVQDESAKWNINALIQLDDTGEILHEILMKLPNMTEDIADAIVDWVDADETSRLAGAESDYYQGLAQPYRAKNAALSSLDELLFVRGITWQLLYGTDRNRNGQLDPGEADLGEFSRGWSEFLTVYGRELNIDRDGNQRIFLNDPNIAEDPNAFAQNLILALGEDLANYVLAAKLYGTASVSTNSNASGSSNSSSSSSRGTGGTGGGNTRGNSNSGGGGGATVQGGAAELKAAVKASLDAGQVPSRRVSSIISLATTQVTLPKPADAPPDAPSVVVRSPLSDTSILGTGLPALLEYCTTNENFELTPRINVNMAPPEVLLGLPGLTQAEVDQIVAVRGSQSPDDPATLTGAWLVTQGNLPLSKFSNIERYVTGRSMMYRVHSVGYFARGGPVARMEAVVDTNQGYPRFVYFRDLTDLGRGFELPR